MMKNINSKNEMAFLHETKSRFCFWAGIQLGNLNPLKNLILLSVAFTFGFSVLFTPAIFGQEVKGYSESNFFTTDMLPQHLKEFKPKTDSETKDTTITEPSDAVAAKPAVERHRGAGILFPGDATTKNYTNKHSQKPQKTWQTKLRYNIIPQLNLFSAVKLPVINPSRNKENQLKFNTEIVVSSITFEQLYARARDTSNKLNTLQSTISAFEIGEDLQIAKGKLEIIGWAYEKANEKFNEFKTSVNNFRPDKATTYDIKDDIEQTKQWLQTRQEKFDVLKSEFKQIQKKVYEAEKRSESIIKKITKKLKKNEKPPKNFPSRVKETPPPIIDKKNANPPKIASKNISQIAVEKTTQAIDKEYKTLVKEWDEFSQKKPKISGVNNNEFEIHKKTLNHFKQRATEIKGKIKNLKKFAGENNVKIPKKITSLESKLETISKRAGYRLAYIKKPPAATAKKPQTVVVRPMTHGNAREIWGQYLSNADETIKDLDRLLNKFKALNETPHTKVWGFL